MTRRLRRPKAEPTELVSLRLPRSLMRALDAQARLENRTRTAVILRALSMLPELTENGTP
ncbi:MAG: ribbon-helix-helix protein, CopG family [Methylocella sp.]